MKLHLHLEHPAPFRTAAGNGEERAAQIDRIQERFSRLQQGSEQSDSPSGADGDRGAKADRSLGFMARK